MPAINSLGIKLGNSNCRLACASIKECGTLGVSCLAGTDEQFLTKTMFTVKYNADFLERFEQCLAGTNDELNPSNIVFDALNLSNANNSICYSDEDFGCIFAKKNSSNYKFELCDENDEKQKNVLFKDIEVVAGILAKLLESVKEQLPEEDGHEIRQIVITVPSLADYEHREKLLKAVKILGLPPQIDVQLMAQITAAAIAYRHKEGDAAQGNVLFFYMGARNTEYAIYKFLEGQTPELISADGFVDFGGENFTIRLVQEQMKDLKREEEKKWTKMEIEEKRMVYRNVRVAMEKVKEQLGCKESATTKIDLGPTLRGRQFTVSREQFEANCKEECRKLELFMASIFKNFKGPISRIVLVGNSSKLYLVRQFFAKFDNKILPTNALAPELAAVQGAAIKAASEAFIANGNGNSPPKSFTRALLPNVAFHAIYGNIYSFDLPCFLMQFGQTFSNEISINSFMNSTWLEQIHNGNNESEIMKSGRLKINTLKYFVKIDKNGLLQFRCQNGNILCENDSILEKCIERFKEYELDVKRVKKEQAKWEENRKREKFLKAQQKQKELEEKKKQQEEDRKRAAELLENKKSEEKATKTSEMTPTKSNQKQIPENTFVDVLFEYPYNKRFNRPFILFGSWDRWAGNIPMKYSKLTNSFVVIIKLKPNEYEYLYGNPNENIWPSFDESKPTRSPPQTLNQKYRNWQVNVLKVTGEMAQIGMDENKIFGNNFMFQQLEKMINAENFMLDLYNQMKKKDNLELTEQHINRNMQKYCDMRTHLPVEINAQALKELLEEADRTYTNFVLISFIYDDWAKVEKQNALSRKSRKADLILREFKSNLLKLTFSKEEIVNLFKNHFCIPMLEECRQLGLEEDSGEILQLNAFLSGNFAYNPFPIGTPI